VPPGTPRGIFFVRTPAFVQAKKNGKPKLAVFLTAD
jgi:hypothetical protein